MQIRRVLPLLRFREIVTLAAFAMLAAVSIVLSNHICVGEHTYAGLVTENYISPYSFSDIVILAVAFAIAFVCCLVAYYLVEAAMSKTSLRSNDDPLRIKPIGVCAIIMMLLHLPCLLTYYPGFIFSDSIASISQALGYAPYSNHHPVAYTLIVQACIELAHMAGLSTTTGCALYSIMQTALMCATYSTIIQWVVQRTGVRSWCRVALVALFGLSPYIATYSIAMWKDPLFSAAIALITILLFDYVKTKGSIAKTSKPWLPLFALCCLTIAFLRSNGLLINLGICLILSILLLHKKAKRDQIYDLNRITVAIPAAALVANLVITGPVYTMLGVIPNEKAEGYGIPLNQMARVVALDGDMSDSDKEYMEQLLPLEEYSNVYAPTCTDPLKWNGQFNSTALESDFAKHWASMLVKNPVVYFESWELQTFGYWTLNQQSALLHDGNISGGVPRTADDPREIESYGITPRNYLGDKAKTIFPYESLSIPIGWLTWLIAFLSIAITLQGRKRYLVALTPCLMLIASLLVASPIWYWERYGAAMQFLLPFFIAMPFAIKKKVSGKTASTLAEEKIANAQ